MANDLNKKKIVSIIALIEIICFIFEIISALDMANMGIMEENSVTYANYDLSRNSE
jgi:hypothetical protein